jgi:hypothetical protein
VSACRPPGGGKRQEADVFVSFLMPDELRGIRARHLLVFYKQVGAFARGEIGFVGTPEYFRPPFELRDEGRPEWHASWREAYQYEPPADLAGVPCFAMPSVAGGHWHARRAAPLAEYRNLLTRRVPAIESAFAAGLDAVSAGRFVDAVLTFGSVPSVNAVARRRGIPVVKNEVGPLRAPDYYRTAYWDRHRRGTHADAAERFRQFRREIARGRIGTLDRGELLRLFRITRLPDGPAPGDAPFRVGIALQGDAEGAAYGFTALDLISIARAQFGRDDVLIRHHPTGLGRYADSLGVIDDSPNPTEFILKCETILTLSSGTAFEAALLGRRCVVVGDSAFRLVGGRALGAPAVRHDATEALNFLALAYLVPYELMYDTAYMRWRLTDPPEIEIARQHCRWYQSRAIGSRELSVEPTRRDFQRLGVPGPLAGSGELLLFGAGGSTGTLIRRLRDAGVVPSAVFDNDAQKWGRDVEGIRIGPPEYRPNARILVASVMHRGAMARQAVSLGYSSMAIMFLSDEAA